MSNAPEDPAIQKGVESLYIEMFMGTAWTKLYSIGAKGEVLKSFNLATPRDLRVNHPAALRVRRAVAVVTISQAMPSKLVGMVELVSSGKVYQFEMTPGLKWFRVTRAVVQNYWNFVGKEESGKK